MEVETDIDAEPGEENDEKGCAATVNCDEAQGLKTRPLERGRAEECLPRRYTSSPEDDDVFVDRRC